LNLETSADKHLFLQPEAQVISMKHALNIIKIMLAHPKGMPGVSLPRHSLMRRFTPILLIVYRGVTIHRCIAICPILDVCIIMKLKIPIYHNAIHIISPDVSIYNVAGKYRNTLTISSRDIMTNIFFERLKKE
jgi:hypothetical protein